MKKRNRIIWKTTAAALTTIFFTTAPVMAAEVDLNATYSISTNEIAGWPAGPEISSNTGILMDADTGAVLYDKGADELRYPASITKLMTLLVAVEHVGLDETVTFTETGVRDVSADSGNIGMQLGETMSMEDCLYAMIIYSANEVSAQIAEYVGGTEQDFIDMMNEKAAELGCTNTHFANASGLPDTNQYTTARDMAKIFQAGLKNDVYRKILGTVDYTIKATNMNGQERALHTHHPLFAPESGLYYTGCLGGKSGMTNDAGHTLVTGVEQNGVTLIAVVLRAADLSTACVDSRALFDYGYQNFQQIAVDGGKVLVPNGTTVDALTKKEEAINGMNKTAYYFQDQLVGIGAAEVVTPTPTPETEKAASIEADSNTTSEDPVAETSQTEKNLPKLRGFLFTVVGFMVAILAILTIALMIHNRKRKHQVK